MAERWSTLEQIEAALALHEQRIPGWVRPAAFAVGVVDEQGTHFPFVNVGTHPLPAVILAEVCGHRHSGNWTYVLTVPELERAIRGLMPAAAWPGSDHPNLHAWLDVIHTLRARPLEDLTIVAVFIGNLDLPPRDEYQVALVKRINAEHG